MRTASIVLVLAGFALAQSPVRFEVISVKRSDPTSRGARMNVENDGSLTVLNQPLLNVITYAYDVRGFQLIGGPGWLEIERYDILAKAKEGRELARERTRALLAERFGLAAHHETRDQAVYLLTVAKGGLRMRISAEEGPEKGIYREDRGQARGFETTTAMIARELAGMTERAVIDQTGLTAKYDWTLEWAADNGDTQRPSLFTALQEQLGLKLETSRGPVDVVVIDHVNRPSDN